MKGGVGSRFGARDRRDDNNRGDIMNDTFERLSGLSIDESIHSGGKQKENFMMDFNGKKKSKDKDKDRAKKMVNAWDMFEKGGEYAPRNKARETYSEIADEDEKDAVFSHSMQRGGLFGQLAASPLKEFLPNKFKKKMPLWAKETAIDPNKSIGAQYGQA